MAARTLRILAGLLIVVAVAPGVSQEPESRDLLDTIRDDLVGLRFEKALAGIEALLAAPDLSPADRAEALVLRSQAHVAFGDLDAAEQDYREILRARPGYEPDLSLTPKKAMDRFRRIQKRMIGRLTLVVDPPDAVVFVDGSPVRAGPGGSLPVTAGEHRVRAESAGFDPDERTVEVAADAEARLELRLVQNSRSVLVLTEPARVAVTLDGVEVGRTARPEQGGGPARLLIENLPLGEHRFDLAKPCYRTERRREILTVDLLDRSALRYGPVRMAPVRSTLILRDGPRGARVLVDGIPEATLPADPIQLCPGPHEIDVRLAARTLWSTTAELAPGSETVMDVSPRPNLAIAAGAQTAAGPFLEAYSVRSTPVRGELSTPAAWQALGLAEDTDLALAPVEGSRAWWLYSPILDVVHRLDGPPEPHERPRWSRVVWGLALVDSKIGGAAMVARVIEGGPAEASGIRAGDRIVALGGSAVEDSSRARALLELASPRAPLAVRWRTPGGELREGRLRGVESVRLETRFEDVPAAAVRAAWARGDAESDPAGPSAPRANLALLLAGFDRHSRAADAWRGVEWPERSGIGRGTASYYLGQALQRIGRETDAVQAYRVAAASRATTRDDEGPRVAPAALDRLADLGVRP